MQILRPFQIDVLKSRGDIYLSKTSLNSFMWHILNKTNEGERLQFLTKNHGLTPWAKRQILRLFLNDLL